MDMDIGIEIEIHIDMDNAMQNGRDWEKPKGLSNPVVRDQRTSRTPFSGQMDCVGDNAAIFHVASRRRSASQDSTRQEESIYWPGPGVPPGASDRGDKEKSSATTLRPNRYDAQPAAVGRLSASPGRGGLPKKSILWTSARRQANFPLAPSDVPGLADTLACPDGGVAFSV
jgi:hypothetical protein